SARAGSETSASTNRTRSMEALQPEFDAGPPTRYAVLGGSSHCERLRYFSSLIYRFRKRTSYGPFPLGMPWTWRPMKPVGMLLLSSVVSVTRTSLMWTVIFFPWALTWYLFHSPFLNAARALGSVRSGLIQPPGVLRPSASP